MSEPTPTEINFTTLTHQSPELDAAYELFSRDIPPAFLEAKDFLRTRLRLRDEGPKREKEKNLVQDGYTLHLIAARQGSSVLGAIYGHLISRIRPDNQGIGFVTYISVLKSHRRRGIGSRLVSELRRQLEQDSRRLTGRALAGMVFEIEARGKEEIKGLVRKMNCRPLDIDYYQPALHKNTTPESMQLWFQPLDPPVLTPEQGRTMTHPTEFIRSMVLNLLTMEYVGPDMNGLDPAGGPYRKFRESLGQRQEIGFLA